MITQTTTTLSDMFASLEEQFDNLTELAWGYDGIDMDESNTVAHEAITQLARIAVLMACDNIMSNSSREMWSEEELDYIDMCIETAQHLEDIE